MICMYLFPMYDVNQSMPLQLAQGEKEVTDNFPSKAVELQELLKVMSRPLMNLYFPI